MRGGVHLVGAENELEASVLLHEGGHLLSIFDSLLVLLLLLGLLRGPQLLAHSGLQGLELLDLVGGIGGLGDLDLSIRPLLLICVIIGNLPFQGQHPLLALLGLLLQSPLLQKLVGGDPSNKEVYVQDDELQQEDDQHAQDRHHHPHWYG